MTSAYIDPMSISSESPVVWVSAYVWQANLEGMDENEF
jgi:hypothetical protein